MHLTLDSGAEANCITISEARRLRIKIEPAGQLASQLDKSKLEVLGEVHINFTRGNISFKFEALVVPEINKASILGGMPFLKTNKITVPFHEDYVKVQNKFKIPVTPSVFVESNSKDQKNSHIIKIRKTTVVMPDEYIEENLPNHFQPNYPCLVSPFDDKLQSQLLPIECDAVGRAIRIINTSDKPIILKKRSQAFQVRPLHSALPAKIKEHKPNMNENPVPNKPQHPDTYLSLLTYDPDGIISKLPNGQDIIARLKKANAEYHEVFNGDLTIGYNGASGPCKANWNFIQEPPTNHGKSVSYIKDDQKLISQAKIDRLYEQKVVQKPSELGVVVKMVNPVMILKKTRVENEPWDKIDPINDTRLVMAANKLNTWMEDIPGDVVTSEEHIAKVSRHKFHINTDLASSFEQIWVDESKYPYLAFNSPFKGQYVMCRTTQGRKGSSETLKQLTSICFGHLEAEKKVQFIHDDAHVGGQDPMETIDNWIEFLKACKKNNIKLSPNKTTFFPHVFDVVGYSVEGQSTLPNVHRINAIKNFELPTTVGRLRSYLGLYKTFVKNQKNQAEVLTGLNELASNSNDKNDKIEWTESLKLKFRNSQAKVDTIEPLYMPKPHDQLVITLDWAALSRGMGAVIWAIVDGTKRVVKHFSANVTEACSKRLLPCEGEALSAKSAVRAFRSLIQMSQRTTIVLTDSEPLLQAIRLLAKGHVSSSQKLNAIACNINGEQAGAELCQAQSSAELEARHYCQNPMQLNSTQLNSKATSVGVRHSSHVFHRPHHNKLSSHFWTS